MPSNFVGRDDLPYAEMHHFINDLQEYPRSVQRSFVEHDFDFAEHQELYEKTFQYRHQSRLAREILTATCMGKKVTEEAIERLNAQNLGA